MLACVGGIPGETCLNIGHPILMPTSPACAAAFQATYDIPGGLEVFEGLAAANEELNTACRAAATQVPIAPLPVTALELPELWNVGRSARVKMNMGRGPCPPSSCQYSFLYLFMHTAAAISRVLNRSKRCTGRTSPTKALPSPNKHIQSVHALHLLCIAG